MSTAFENLNWTAIMVAALSAFIIGGIWYSALFSKQWMSANSFSKDVLATRNMGLVFGGSFVLIFFMALNLAMFIGKEGTSFGAMAGFLAGFGWVALGIGVVSLFEKRPLAYVLINGGYMIVSFTIMGVILGAWK
jgi:hypothetical protein